MILVTCVLGLAVKTRPQEASGSLEVWETPAVAQQTVVTASVNPEELLAAWIVQDLSPRDKHD